LGGRRPGPTGEATGVGLGNIRERLFQAYGDDHLFALLPNDSSGPVQDERPRGEGLLVVIDIPLQSAPVALPEAERRPVLQEVAP
ncbi:MAG: hypothetical protein ACK4TG_07235, partial [Thermaurantiacus sp.]